MNYTKKLEDLSNYERCLTNKKDYVKYNGIIIYKWDYITHKNIEEITDNTSENITNTLRDFTIPAIYTEDEWRGTLDVSPLLIINLSQIIKEEEKEWKENFINVTANHNKEKIFEFLVTDLYENLILVYNTDSDGKIIASVHQLYTNIENIFNSSEIWDQMADYKKQKNLKNRLNEDHNKIKSPIIKIQLEQIMLYIHDFIDSLDIKIQNELLKNIEWKWRKTIISKSKKYLYDKYHTKELNYLLYQDYLTQFHYSIEQLYYSLEGGKQEIEKWEELPKANYYIEKLRNDILQYIKWIQIKSKDDDDEINTILNNIDENLFDRFLRDYYDLEEDDDTWSQSRFLADDFSNINNYLEQLIRNKDYQYIATQLINESEKSNIDTLLIWWLSNQSQKSNNTQKLLKETTNVLSARYLFNKISTYRKEKDKENAISCIITLQKCNDKEIKNLLSLNDLRQLIEIITRTNEEYMFAERIRKILGIDTE